MKVLSLYGAAVIASGARIAGPARCHKMVIIGNFQLKSNTVTELCIANPTAGPLSVLWWAKYGIILVDHRMNLDSLDHLLQAVALLHNS